MAPVSSTASVVLGILTFILFLGIVFSDPTNLSFSYRRFDQETVGISLFGDSKVVNGGFAIELSGQAVYEEPIRVVAGDPKSLATFSTNFSFSMAPGDGDGFAFAMAPGKASSVLSEFGRFGLPLVRNISADGLVVVEFDARENHVGIDSSSSKLRNASSVHLGLKSGQMIQCWIDYEAGLRRLVIRLSKFGDSKPLEPFIAKDVDLWKLWKERDVFFGFSSLLEGSNKSCFIHSWSFQLRWFPHWLHSRPLDPNAVSKDSKSLAEPCEKSNCLLKVLAAMMYGIGGGALSTFCIFYLWIVFGSRRAVAPEEFVGKEKQEKLPDYGYKRVELVVVDKAIKDGC